MRLLHTGKLGFGVAGPSTCLAAIALALAIAAPAQASSGAFERTWGMDVVAGGGTGFEICTAAASCKTGTVGGLGGEFNPNGVATDGAGNVYVADFSNNRIQEFDCSGNFLRAWGKDVVAGGGTGFEICTAAGSCKAGASGGLGGEFNGPGADGVAADAAGNVYVADFFNRRIQKFDSSGSFLRAWGKDVVAGGGTGFEICTVAASCKAGLLSGGLGGELEPPGGVAADAAGSVYVADRFNHRIQKFDSSGSFQRAWGKDVVAGGGTGFEICTAAQSCKAGAIGGLGGEFNLPVVSDAAGSVYVTEQGNNRIQKFDSSGSFLRAWGKDVVAGGGTGFEICTVAASCKAGAYGGLAGEFIDPAGVATDAAGSVYVAELSNNRIQKFDSSGSFQRAWGKAVVAGGGTGFEICTVAGSCKAGAIGGLGGELNLPIGAATDAAGSVYVADTFNNRIQKFRGGTFEIVGLVGRILTLTVPGAGEIEVTDAAARRVSAAAKKKLLKPASATASGPGAVKVKLKLTKPAKKKLKRKGKVKVKAAITYTPTGGSAYTETAKLKVKKKK